MAQVGTSLGFKYIPYTATWTFGARNHWLLKLWTCRGGFLLWAGYIGLEFLWC